MTQTKDFRGLRHFIWDFDGTLFDTYPVMIQNLRDALARFGRDAAPAEVMKLMLNIIVFAKDHYAEKFDIEPDALNAAYLEFRRQANTEMVAPPMEGVVEVLRRIRDTGRENYIFTHRSLGETQAYLEKNGLAGLFLELVGPETPGFAWKPAPDAITYLLEKYHLNPEETAMVGDREIDLGSGRNAGVKTIHVVCRMVPEDLVCDWQFEDYQTMLQMLG